MKEVIEELEARAGECDRAADGAERQAAEFDGRAQTQRNEAAKHRKTAAQFRTAIARLTKEK